MTDEPFSLADELERKTLDALSRILSDWETGAVSQPAAAFALRTLFDTTSGLVGNELFDLVSEASKKVNAEQTLDCQRRFFIHAGGDVCIIEYQYGEACITLKRGALRGGHVAWTRDSKATFEGEPNPFETAGSRFIQYADAMRRLGFVEVK